MTSKLTRERIELIANFHRAMTLPPSHAEIEELARMALAAMDSEPVAEVVSIYGDPEAFGEREIRPLVGIQQMPYGTKLYRHAQPDASHLSRICAESYQVVGALAEALRVFNDVGVIKALDNLADQELIHDDVLPFSVPEAAQPAPVVPDDVLNALQDVARIRADLNNLDGDYRGVGSCLWEAEERLLEIVAQRSAMLSGGKS